jgi:hypothetical protein
MSDGLSDAAAAARARAERFVVSRYSSTRRIYRLEDAPQRGVVVYVYEEWLRHIVELVENRRVVERWLVEPYCDNAVSSLSIKKDWPIGYYRTHRVVRQ